ncbi:LLM class F420-dependent oxidoreductase [Jiangella rhizosphaerae]|uniref:LLM class F420-dependent oxidoreductase n=1 Tax=Jiangella rhizosphaerae TaxID=2293569 RepID=A0A418KMB7_9ACTN|nr:LLM class F420-dependent oxidoreductase [Jiangella rhizosphaerae]RIQ19552.1 LLM class F420-dependent oxidoreductase [Jiangella rhizosphaerae]
MAIEVGRAGVWIGARSWPGDTAEVAEAFTELEALGYGAAWLGGAEADLVRPEQVLAATTRLTAATGIVNVWTEPADEVAAAFQRVDGAYPDRLLLGIGAGHAKFVEQYHRPYSKVVEYLDQLDAAGVPARKRAVAALGPRTIRLAGERSLGAHPYLVTPRHTRLARDVLGDGPLLAPEQKVVLSADEDEVLRIAGPVVAFYLGLPNYVNSLRRLGFTDDDLSGSGSRRLVDALVAWGDPETIAARVAEHHVAGADHVCVQVLTGRPGLPRAEWRALAPALVSD